ncbi:uncharacterized protein [Aquarana catesbeiana]|uniref:uncharacterized protein isoform X5 n=1 Tax=Aquarana catesbeiana TaxID=8400 RepID=UPI003CC92BCE
MTGECSEVVTGIGEEGDTASEDGGTSSGGGDTALRGSRARMKVKSPPPPGAMMYSLLLLAHMTLAVTASTTFTAGVTPESPQSFTHADRHTDETSAHIPATSKVLGTSAPHTDRHTDATSAHIPATSKVLGTSAPHTDRHTDTTSAHIPVIPKVLATSAPHTETITVRQTDRHTKAKIPEIFSTVHHSTFVSEHHSTGIHSTVTKKELQSVTQKTHAPHITKSISVPNVRVEIGNGFQITCFSERGPEVINYELIQGDRIVKNMTVHGRKAATFQFDITPGPSIIYCRARTLSGEEVTSEPLKIEGDNPDSEEKPGDSKKSEKEEWDAAPKFLISLTYILTSVSQPVQDLNAIIISVCGPIILIVLLLIFLTHFCNRRGRKAGSSRLVCCV